MGCDGVEEIRAGGGLSVSESLRRRRRTPCIGEGGAVSVGGVGASAGGGASGGATSGSERRELGA